MDESESLDALEGILNKLSESPYDLSLHVQHVRMAQSTPDLLLPALEMFTTCFAAGEEVWLPLISAKQDVLDLDVSPKEAIDEVLQLYESAERDYLSIPTLQKHLEFLAQAHSHFSTQDPASKRQDLGEIFSTEWTRVALSAVASQGNGHLNKSHDLWQIVFDWELEILERADTADKQRLAEHLEGMLLIRLRQPHYNNEETFQTYSTFTTRYKPPQKYESLLVAASKLRSQALKKYSKREPFETALMQSTSLDAYAQYIASEQRPRQVDEFILTGLFERAIAEAARRRWSGDTTAEHALRAFWIGYLDAQKRLDVPSTERLEVVKRGVRSVPASGEVCAKYLRLLEEIENEASLSTPETVAEVYTTALAKNLIQKDVDQIVPLTLACAGYEKRRVETGKAGPDAFTSLVNIVEKGMVMVKKANSNGDSKFRLEKYLAELYLQLDMANQAIAVWKAATERYKSSYLAWTSFADVLIKENQHNKARTLFKNQVNKKIDWPEAVWEAWIAFEHLHGTVQELELCLASVEKAKVAVNAQRAQEQAAYQAMQAEEQQTDFTPVDGQSSDDPSMHIDQAQDSKKRKSENDRNPEENKKARTQMQPPPLKRDRENSTVFVADLVDGVTSDELKTLFKDCGSIREVKITKLPGSIVATVEFSDRDCVSAALSKDKKRLRGSEIAVHLAWKSTLYVTNFPEKVDDASIKHLFSEYGTLFETRWPSKKFKSTRRFCYVQFISPSSAEKALELHGRELEPGMHLSVMISDPERRKERTDADANDREIYVAGLSKFTTKEDLHRLFSTYGDVKDVRMATDNGRSKGFAFVEFSSEKDANAALAANNHELKSRRIAVTLADNRFRARNAPSGSGLGKSADVRNRSVRVQNLPLGTQEGLLQQVFEKHASVRRVEVFTDINEAVVELENQAEAGRLLLQTNPIQVEGNVLELTEEVGAGRFASRTAASHTRTEGMFVPRMAVSKPRAGLGHARRPTISANKTNNGEATPKGQDEFRKML